MRSPFILSLMLSVLCPVVIHAQDAELLAPEPVSGAPALLISPKEAPQKPKPAANILLLASVSGKLVGLTFHTLNLNDIILQNNSGDTAIIEPRSPIFGAMSSIGWGFAAVTGGAAYVVDDTSVRPWMFYTELAAYGSIGLGLGAAMLYANFNEGGNPENVKPLGIRSGIFLSSGLAAGLAAHWLKKSRVEARE
jgi:hypothetical protein